MGAEGKVRFYSQKPVLIVRGLHMHFRRSIACICGAGVRLRPCGKDFVSCKCTEDTVGLDSVDSLDQRKHI